MPAPRRACACSAIARHRRDTSRNPGAAAPRRTRPASPARPFCTSPCGRSYRPAGRAQVFRPQHRRSASRTRGRSVRATRPAAPTPRWLLPRPRRCRTVRERNDYRRDCRHPASAALRRRCEATRAASCVHRRPPRARCATAIRASPSSSPNSSCQFQRNMRFQLRGLRRIARKCRGSEGQIASHSAPATQASARIAPTSRPGTSSYSPKPRRLPR